jgi:hypothetical protein
MLSDIICASNPSLSNPEPINPRSYIRRAILNVILSVVIGTWTTSVDDPLFKRLDKWVNDVTRMYSNVNRKLDYFPILKYHPGNKMKKVNVLFVTHKHNVYFVYSNLSNLFL